MFGLKQIIPAPTLSWLKRWKPQWLKSILASALDLAYPPLCFHCEAESGGNPLCLSCLEQLEFIDPNGRCRYCFYEKVNPSQKVCRKCLDEEPIFDGVSAAFEYIGPITTLIPQLKYGNKYWLAEGLGGYMAAQFLQMDWPIPDVIAPVPMAWNKSLARGYNQSYLLAASVGKILKVPVKPLLKRRCGDFSQAGLTKERRIGLDGQNIRLKRSVYDQTVLLIDDVITTGSTLKRCGEALLEGCPSKIYALSLART